MTRKGLICRKSQPTNQLIYSNTISSISVKYQQYLNLYLTNQRDPKQVDMGIMTMKRNAILPRSQELELHHKIQLSVKPKNQFFWSGGVTTLPGIQTAYSKPRRLGDVKKWIRGLQENMSPPSETMERNFDWQFQILC